MLTIDMRFDDPASVYVVRLPDPIRLAALKQWELTLSRIARASSRQPLTLLIDSGIHHFESLEALRYLRTLLSSGPIASALVRVAFVAPARFRPEEIVSDREAYFNRFEDALAWLRTVKIKGDHLF